MDAPVILNRVVREGFTQKAMLRGRPKNSEGHSHVDI